MSDYKAGYTAGWDECARLFKDNGLALGAKDATIAALNQRVAELERERDAYRKAKQENDERFMIERDEARAQLATMTKEPRDEKAE